MMIFVVLFVVLVNCQQKSLVPVPSPSSEPSPIPVPQSEPSPNPVPNPQSEPSPNPQSEPSPIPVPNPQSEPIPNPQSEPTPSSEPIPNPQSEPSPSPVPNNSTTDPNQHIYDIVEDVLGGLSIAIGLMWATFGYRFMIKPRITLFLAGFIIAYFLSYQLLFRFTYTAKLLELWVSYIIATICGIIAGILLMLSIPVGRFFFSALMGVLFTTLLFVYTPLGALSLKAEYILIIIAGVGFVVGFISLFINKLIPIIGTSFNGAFLMANAVDRFTAFSPSNQLLASILQNAGPDYTKNYRLEVSNWRIYVVLGVIIVITILGSIFQYKVSAARVNPNGTDDDRDSESLPLLVSSNV